MEIHTAELKVINYRRGYQNHWREKSNSYWFARLIEEVAELGMSLEGEHEHVPELELTQIASICINWMEKREGENGNIDFD